MVIALKNSHLWYDNYQTFLSHGSQTYSNHMESQCLIYITIFIKTKNHFNHFFSIFASFSTHWCTFFWHKYTLESHNISWKKYFLIIQLFMLWSTILCKIFGKICFKITMVEVQTWTPLGNSIMWQHFWPPHSVFSPYIT